MAITANDIIKQAEAWLGKNENDGTFKAIIDIYNEHKPLARGYKVKYTDEWCATFVSAVSIACGATAIIPTECSCQKQIELFKGLGVWIEDESKTPKAGDIIYYDWQDNGKGNNTGWADHVGIVQKVTDSYIYVIEGNYSRSVKIRKIKKDAKTLRGFATPAYSKAQTATTKNNAVLAWQKAAIADGFKFPKHGADGSWGAECESVAKQAIVRKRTTYKNKNLTKIVQKAVGVKVDGLCGSKTAKAIKEYQRKNKLTIDGCVGLRTWRKILGIK